MSLKNHIELSKVVSELEKRQRVSQFFRDAFGRIIPSIGGRFCLLDDKEEVSVCPNYDYSQLSKKKNQELEAIFARNMSRVDDLMKKGDEHCDVQLESPTWLADFIKGFKVTLPHDGWEVEAFDHDGLLIPSPGYEGPFCDIDTHFTVLSILEARGLLPDNESKANFNHQDYLAQIRNTQARMKMFQMGLGGTPYTAGDIVARINDDECLLAELEERVSELEKEIRTEGSNKELVFHGKNTVLVTPESYQSACEVLGIEPGATSYARAHKAYIRKLAQFHPDSITKQALSLLPSKPKKGLFGSIQGPEDNIGKNYEQYVQRELPENEFYKLRKNYVESRLGMIESNILDAIKLCERYLHNGGTFGDSQFSEDFLKGLKEKFHISGGTIQNMSDFEEIVTSEYLRIKYYGISVTEFRDIQENTSKKIKIWEGELKKKEGEIGEVYAKNRQILMDAWEIVQSYHGMPWEQAKDIDIIYGEMSWGDNDNYLYNAIALERTDIMIAKSFLLKRGGLWYSNWGRYNYDTGRTGRGKESIFSCMWNFFGDADRPEGLTNLATLLESRKYEPAKIQAQAKILSEAIFQKPEGFDKLMETIYEHPWMYSESYEEYEFEPTLRFGKGYTWEYGMYPQDYDISLWLLFGHIYLNTTGTIPFRLGEKFVRKYLPDSTPHEVAEILEKMQQRIPGESILAPRLEVYSGMIAYNIRYSWNQELPEEAQREKDEWNSKLRKCSDLANSIDEIYSGITVELQNCISNGGTSSRVGIELSPDGGLSIYYPHMEHYGSGKICSLYFSQKEVATLYLAMLESPILDSMNDVSNRLVNLQ